MDRPALKSVRERLAGELDSLVKQGWKMVEYLSSGKPDRFASGYQEWYTRALGAVRELLPDRLAEFTALYHGETRKQRDIITYSISDYVRGLKFSTASQQEQAAIGVKNTFQHQVLIIASASTRLDDILSNIRGVVQAEVLDHEIEAARHLLNANHLRAAGAVAGVVLERHLKEMCAVRNLTSRKKNPTISDWNELLKEACVLDVPQWRAIQHMADIRNLCDHPKERDPTKDEVADQIRGVETAIKILF